MTDLAFFVLAAVLVAAGLVVVTAKSLFRAAFALSAALLATAGLYLLLTAPLLARRIGAPVLVVPGENLWASAATQSELASGAMAVGTINSAAINSVTLRAR